MAKVLSLYEKLLRKAAKQEKSIKQLETKVNTLYIKFANCTAPEERQQLIFESNELLSDLKWLRLEHGLNQVAMYGKR